MVEKKKGKYIYRERRQIDRNSKNVIERRKE